MTLAHVPSFPKILHIEECSFSPSAVEITEKIDGSMFGFAKIEGVMAFRSKERQINPLQANMFQLAVNYLLSIQERIPEGYTFYAEYLQKKKHNRIAYERLPKNYLYLFAVKSADGEWGQVKPFASLLDIEPPHFVPREVEGDSILGGKREGIVIKQYEPEFVVAKIVRPDFNEIKSKTIKNGTKWEEYCSNYKTEARWLKAIQHLRDQDLLTGDMSDIGKIIPEINKDIKEEETERIKSDMWTIFHKDILRSATQGFPEWYRGYLREMAGYADVSPPKQSQA